MTRRRMKAYLPRWVMWIIVPLLGVIWGIITYATFGTPGGRDDPGALVWAGATLVLALVGAMMVLMGTGRLAMFEIEVREADRHDT